LHCSLILNAQEITVKGTVTAASDGTPIPGVTIIKKGTNTGTTTDFDGLYSIQVNTGDVLEFSYISMETQTVTVTGTTLDIVLKEQAESLDEVVIIGYGTVKKKEVIGAVASVKAKDIENIVTTDLGNAIQGQVSGVNIISDARPGGQSEILIRGITSINGSSTPLFVIDGIPQEENPNIPPGDIESIDILKDAASAGIYGARGATGVILITTRQGKAGTLAIRANATYGIKDITSGTPLMNREQQTYFDLIRSRNDGNTDDQTILPLVRNVGNFQNDTNLSELAFIDNASFQNYTVNISGGTKDIKYNVSTGLFDENGIVINSGFKRFNTRANTTYQRGKWKISAIVGLTKERTYRSPGSIIDQTIRYLPTQQSIDPNSDEPIFSIGGDSGNRVGWVLESFGQKDTENVTKAYATFNVNYEITKGLNIWSRVGINESNGYRDRFARFSPVFNIETGLQIPVERSNAVEAIASRRSSTAWETIATYKKQIEDHTLTFTGAYTREEFTGQGFRGRREDLISNDIQVLNSGRLNPSTQSDRHYTTTLIGVLGRLQYNYKGKYFLSSSVRRDGSSRFGEENKWGIFPSISAGWTVSEEKFWQPLKSVVNNFKVRANRGAIGNNRIPDFAFSTSITPNIDYALGTDEDLASGAVQAGFANKDVKWETKKETNIGIDLSLFKNKITISADRYDIRNEDMLFPVRVPAGAGGGTNSIVQLNVGSMTNEGYELAIGYKDKIGKLNFSMNGTFTTNDNVITDMNGVDFRLTDDFGLVNGARESSQITGFKVGREAGAFFLFRTDGIIDTPEKLTEYQQIVPGARMGDLIYVDQPTVDTDGDGILDAGDGEISDSDRKYSGSGLPEYEIGFNLNFDYKGFDLSTQWYAALGHEIMNGAKATAYGWGRHRDLLFAYSDVNTNTNIPAYRDNLKNHENFKAFTDLWLEDGDYLRLKNITLGYSLPKKTIDKLGLTKFRLYVTGQNILTITDYEGFDPEVGGGISSRGLDKGNYPITSQYLFGLNLNF